MGKGKENNKENKQMLLVGKNYYKDKIIEMIKQINNEEYLLKIYSFTKVFSEN